MMENPKPCSKCGRPVAPGMKFCESCGAKIEAVPVCLNCGAALAPNGKFCESCGTPIAPAAAPVIPAKEDSMPVAAPVPPVRETAPVQNAPLRSRPPINEIPVEVGQVNATAAAPVPPASESAEIKDVKPLVEPAVKAEEKPVPAPEKKTAPVPASVKESSKTEQVREVPKGTGPKKPIPRQTMIIAGVIVLALLGAAVYSVGLPMLSGSETPTQNPTGSPVTTNPVRSSGTPMPTADTSQAVSVSLTTGPTQVPPPNLGLIIDVERDAISHIITVTFQGGAGQYGVRELVVTLTKSDGTVETKSFKPEFRGTFITMKGTEKADRVEITANYYNGESYKVVDQIFEYKKRIGSP